MCGLWGGYSKWLGTTEVENVISLAAINYGRGKDSTGIISIFENKGKLDYSPLKALGDPASFFNHKNVQEDVKDYPIAILGHNRWKTMGDITVDNAHPFASGHIIGMHNGTVPAFAPDKKDEHNTTDSKNLIEHLAQHGLQSVIDEAGLSGAMALVWVDKKLGTLNFYRNWHRPLSVMFSSGNNSMYWSSEALALKLIDSREKITFQAPESLMVEKHYWLKLGEPLKMYRKDMKPPGTVKYTPMTAAQVVEAREDKKNEETRPTKLTKQEKKDQKLHQRMQTTQRILDQDTGGQATSESGEKSTIIHLPKTSVPSIYTQTLKPGDWYAGYNNECWSVAKVVGKLTATTCEMCLKRPTIFEPIYWISPDHYVCHAHLAEAKVITNGDVHLGAIKRGH